jgi:signal transduction histidine kinase
LDILGDNIDDYTKEEIEKLIHIASNSAINTYNLLENLMAWSVSQNKEKNFNPVKIDLHELIIKEMESYQILALQKQITINHSIAPNLHVTADIQMVKTIFRNLMSNAIKYSNANGVILIHATEGKQFVEIEVKDNGIGISHDSQGKLFKMDEFHSTLGTKNEPGTGMGLLFCKEFVDLHGGRIWVESEIDKGSKFKFTLPHYI